MSAEQEKNIKNTQPSDTPPQQDQHASGAGSAFAGHGGEDWDARIAEAIGKGGATTQAIQTVLGSLSWDMIKGEIQAEVKRQISEDFQAILNPMMTTMERTFGKNGANNTKTNF